MKYAIQYLSTLQNMIQKLIDSQVHELENATEIMVNTILNDGFIYVFGTGHSHILAEELFYRAGGLTRIYPILEEGLMLHNGAIKSTDMERVSGLAEVLSSQYYFTKNDAIIICSNSGRNNVVVEMAQIAKSKGMQVVALTNMAHSKSVESRHASGLKLYQIADVILDNLGVKGDASITVPNVPSKTGATSTVIGAAILHVLEVTTVEKLITMGINPEIYQSSNLDNSEELNDLYFKKYRNIIKDL
jgi:uncharacterized phosphosugar-binding protein